MDNNSILSNEYRLRILPIKNGHLAVSVLFILKEYSKNLPLCFLLDFLERIHKAFWRKR